MGSLDLQAAKRVYESAKAPEDVFGPLADKDALNAAFRRLVRVVHPDKYASDAADHDLATHVIAELNGWRTIAEQKLAAGTYGDGAPHTAPSAPVETVIETPKRKYVLSAPFATGDVADLYACEFDGAQAVFKVAMSAADNDLLEAEAKSLRALKGDGTRFYRYIPTLLDTFTLRGERGRAPRRVNVVQRALGCVTLADVLRHYPGGVDFRDMAWMFKRALAALGFVHHAGLVHGAVLPEHVMVHPTEHGAKLVDWCYSVPAGSRVRAVSKAHRAMVAPEILAKGPATAQTDVYMLGKCMEALLCTALTPPTVLTFLASCTIAQPSRRPSSAWALHEEFDELLRRLVGRPQFRPLAM
jgi:serine/threonine protein kinase